LKFFLYFVFPVKCVGCGQSGVVICEKCLQNIPILETQECPTCRRSSIFGGFCRTSGLGTACANYDRCVDNIEYVNSASHADDSSCMERFLDEKCYFDNLMVFCRYDKNGLLKLLIEQFKYNFSKEVLSTFEKIIIKQSDLLFNFLKQYYEQYFGTIYVVPVPLHKRRFKDRGFNQSELLAKVFIKVIESIKTIKSGTFEQHFNLQSNFKFELSQLLRRIIYTEPQAKLNRCERLKNIKNAFAVKDYIKLNPKIPVILIDDVCTTGTTINECAKALKQAGVQKISALVLARGDGH
jgi:predicted amidophosphoribosyltransferase